MFQNFYKSSKYTAFFWHATEAMHMEEWNGGWYSGLKNPKNQI